MLFLCVIILTVRFHAKNIYSIEHVSKHFTLEDLKLTIMNLSLKLKLIYFWFFFNKIKEHINPSCASRIFQSIPVQPPGTAVSIWTGEPSGKPRLSSLSCRPEENLSFQSKNALNHYEMYSVKCYPLLLTFYFISAPKSRLMEGMCIFN